MIRPFFCALLAASAGLTNAVALAATPESAPQQRTWQLEGGTLRIDSPCAKRVTVEPGTGPIAVVATARNPEELDRLAPTGGTTAVVGRAPGTKCYRRGPTWSPTLEVAIRVPAGLALEIHEDGVGGYAVTVSVGALVLDLRSSGGVQVRSASTATVGSHGSGDVAIAEVAGAASVDATGSGRVSFGSVGGPLTVKLSGSGEVRADAVAAPVTSIVASGSGGVRIGGGSVGALQVNATGSGDVQVDAAAGDATVRATGSGDVRVAKASGRVTSDGHGSGTVSIGR